MKFENFWKAKKAFLICFTGALTLAVSFFCGIARADVIPISNSDFTATDAGLPSFAWSTALSIGNGGAYDPSNQTVAGSTAISPYSASGGITNAMNYPTGVTTAGVFIADAGDVPAGNIQPANWTSNTQNVIIGTTRASSSEGDLYSFYQDTGVKFASDTTYTLTAYASSIGSGNGGFANTGVGFSGTTPLTALQLEANPNLAGLGQSIDQTTLQLETVTIDTSLSQYSSLVGQDIIVNLLDETVVTGGGRGAYFTDVTLTSASAVPEPSMWVLMLAGLGLLVCLKRRSLSA